MTTATISVRISEELKDEVMKFAADEKLELTSEAARKLLLIGIEDWHRKKALNLLSKGRITLSKAAEIAKTNIWDMLETAKEHGILIAKERAFIEKDLL